MSAMWRQRLEQEAPRVVDLERSRLPAPIPAHGAAPGPDGADIARLITHMQNGDRSAAATFITRYGSRLRRRIRGKLSPGMRRLFDTQDIISTVGRRLDRYILAGKLDVHSEEQLWTLLVRMLSRAVIDKARVFRNLEQAEAEDGVFAHAMLLRLQRAESEDSRGTERVIERAIEHLDDDIDRRILLMWLDGRPHSEIAVETGLTHPAVRQRWQVIKSSLHQRFVSEFG